MTATKQISFDVSRLEARFIDKIVKRAMADAKKSGMDLDAVSISMDLTATHANGCCLDLEKLLNAPDFDFSHDVFGIRRHIDRKTGQLGGCFLPRCAMPDPTSD